MRQEAIRERCFHPTGTFVPFARAEIGCLTVLGRLDHQVKVRGFRVRMEDA